jgi:hypothetical protein
MGWDTDNNNICLDTSRTLAATGGCQAVPSPQRFYGATVSNLSGQPGADGACPDRPALPALAFSAKGSLCTPSGGACVPPPAPSGLCLRHDGDVACPAEAPVKHLVAAAADVVDGRTCGACGCAVGSCSGYSLTFYTDAACTQSPAPITISGSCTNAPGITSAHAYFRLQATASACAPASVSSALSGQATLRNTFTLCCGS